MYLLVGLGNPGNEYAFSRHNAGFWFAEEFAKRAQAGLPQGRFEGLYQKGSYQGESFVILRPLTYMNLSGRSVAECARFFKIPSERIIVAFDDLDLTPGKIKMRFGGSEGGHKGVRDIIAKLGTDKFYRLKIGIGKPEFKGQVVDWVIRPLSLEQQLEIKSEFSSLYERIDQILVQGKASKI